MLGLLHTLVELTTRDTSRANYCLTTVVDVAAKCGKVLLVIVNFSSYIYTHFSELVVSATAHWLRSSKASPTKNFKLWNLL